MKLVRRDKDKRFPKLGNRFFTYDLISEQRTDQLMQAFVKNRWTYPMTLYVESMSADKEKEMHSIKKSFTLPEQAGSANIFQLSYCKLRTKQCSSKHLPNYFTLRSKISSLR